MQSIPGIIARVECHEGLLPGQFRAYVVRKFSKPEKNRFEPESECYHVFEGELASSQRPEMLEASYETLELSF